MSQQRIDGVLSVDLRPKGPRAGKVPSRVVYLVLLRNLRPRQTEPATWTVTTAIDPPSPGIAVEYPSSVTLPPQIQTGRRKEDPQAIVVVTEGAVPDTEVEIVMTFARAEYRIIVRRRFTVLPTKGNRRPR